MNLAGLVLRGGMAIVFTVVLLLVTACAASIILIAVGALVWLIAGLVLALLGFTLMGSILWGLAIAAGVDFVITCAIAFNEVH